MKIQASKKLQHAPTQAIQESTVMEKNLLKSHSSVNPQMIEFSSSDTFDGNIEEVVVEVVGSISGFKV